ncbi:MAG: phenylacetate--CoA ligase [Verrucomicrobia bacterium]|nr:phenylacetate--CoA ligase [Verrucomicrobiota bacterium]
MIETLRTAMLLRHLCANVRRDPVILAAEQDRLLRHTVEHAWRHVPFYRRYWLDAGFDPKKFGGLADLERIPIVSRATLDPAARAGELLATGVDREQCTWLDTTGTGGMPLRIYKQRREERVRRAVGLRIWLEHGFSWRDATVDFQRDAGPSHPLQRFGIAPKEFILCDVPAEQRLSRFLAMKPAVVVGTATALRRIARDVQRAGVAVRRPRVVFCAGEYADTFTRRLVKSVFGTEPVGVYGQSEVGYIGWQCEQRGAFHLNADTHLVEVRRDGRAARPGELGRLIVTDLYARTMPFLRYDAGDLAIAGGETCSCGRTLPVVQSMEGRVSGVLVAADGRPVTACAVVEALCEHILLEDVQVVQHATGEIELVVVETAATQDNIAAIVAALEQLLGRSAVVSTKPQWASPRDWKTRSVVSHFFTARDSGDR